MKRDESAYLRHILDAIVRAEEYLQGLDEAAFIRNSLVQDGVIRQIEIIGEAKRQDDYRPNYVAVIPTFPGKTSPECVTNSFTITSE